MGCTESRHPPAPQGSMDEAARKIREKYTTAGGGSSGLTMQEQIDAKRKTAAAAAAQVTASTHLAAPAKH